LRYLLPVLGLWLAVASIARAQGDEGELLSLSVPAQSGLRNWLNDSWTTLEFTIANRGSEDRLCRLIVFYSSQPDVQYARDLWVPGNSFHKSWTLLGPPPLKQDIKGNLQAERAVDVLLYDRTGGQDRLVLPRGEQRVRSRAFLYKPRDPITSVLVDRSDHDLVVPSQMSEKTEQALRLLYAFRMRSGQLPLHLELIRDRFLPPTVEGFDGVDWFVIAGRHLAEDPPGELALRKWVEQGGNLWVMLDLTDPRIVARLLGDSLPIQVVDRTSSTRLQILNPELRAEEQSPPLELEQAVDIVRVLLTPQDRLLHTINGWPASFVRSYGRGRVLFTTVGAQAWFRERTNTKADLEPLTEAIPNLPVSLTPLDELARKLGVARPAKIPYADILQPLVGSEVGYAVPDQSFAAAIFAAFVLSALVVGLLLQRATHRLELSALAAPALAVVAALVFFVVGRQTRNAIPPTVSAAEVITVATATKEQLAQGLLAQYRPEAGDLPVGSTKGGTFELDDAGLEGKTRRRVITDTHAWHWEDLALPGGLRLARYEHTVATDKPLSAIAQFGPEGITGRIEAGPFTELSDALVSASTGRQTVVHLRGDGAFTIGNEDVLPPGQYLSDVVLSDQQQRRVAIYRRLLSEPDSLQRDDHAVLYVWSKPPAIPFTLDPRARTIESSLLAIPVEFARGPANIPITVPTAFIPFRRIVNGLIGLPTLESGAGVDMHLRFQLPATVLPLDVQQARLFAKVRAPQRRFAIAAFKAGKPVELFAQDGVVGPLTVEIKQEALLKLDEQGGLHVNVAVGELPPDMAMDTAGNELRWSIESIEMEITGRTLPAKLK
jgi:hypothetical protein